MWHLLTSDGFSQAMLWLINELSCLHLFVKFHVLMIKWLISFTSNSYFFTGDKTISWGHFSYLNVIYAWKFYSVLRNCGDESAVELLIAAHWLTCNMAQPGGSPILPIYTYILYMGENCPRSWHSIFETAGLFAAEPSNYVETLFAQYQIILPGWAL